MKRVFLAAVFVIACAAAGHLSTRTVSTQGSSCLVSLTSGGVQGADRGAACAFLGIPFAAPPVGTLRWKPPHPAAAWAPTVLNATVPPSGCPQIVPPAGAPSGSEDCLKLNVWTPNPVPSSGAPVIVWLHPGSFASASANFAPQNGQNFAALSGAIVVAPNYRLGPFGYLRHEALAAESDAAGNFGLLDQRAALLWVRDHIAGFGGDPGRVTIAGQSAGAHSVGLHLVSPGSAGLFHGAIMQSGFASFRWRTAAEADAQGNDFATALGCGGADASLLLACLRLKNRDQVLLAGPPALLEQYGETGRTQWTPVVDGIVIPDQPRFLYEQGSFSRVPVLLGANRDEGWTFVTRGLPSSLTLDQYEAAVGSEFGDAAAAVLSAYSAADFASPRDAVVQLVGDVEYACEARRVSRLIERTGTPVFLYSFEYEVDPVVPDRVAHGFDVNFVFGNNFAPPLFANYVLSAGDLALSRAMSAYWMHFASRGNPNSDELTALHWPAFKHPSGLGRGADKFLIFDSEIREGKRLRDVQCDFWEPYFFRSVTGAVPASTP